MKKLKLLLLLTLVLLVSGCGIFSNSKNYEETTSLFVESILNENYDESVTYLNADSVYVNKYYDKIYSTFSITRDVILSNYGKELEYKVLSTKKIVFLTHNNTESTGIKVLIQIANKENYGILEVTFDSKSNKIQDFYFTEKGFKIPDMTFFWLFGLFALCIPIFNIYVIVKIKKSKIKRKFLKYIIIAIINAPTISFSLANSFSIELANMQFLGFGYIYKGYMNDMLSFGIPIGAFWALYKLKQLKKREKLAALNDEIEVKT